MNNYNQNDYMTPAGIPMGYIMPKAEPYSIEVATPYEGFIRGNMFPRLYDPYIKAEPFPLQPQNEREALLDKLRAYQFATVDLNLYLDTHPEDTEKIKLYSKYNDMERETRKEYESKYGPLTLNSEALDAYPWTWLMSPWPWEVI